MTDGASRMKTLRRRSAAHEPIVVGHVIGAGPFETKEIAFILASRHVYTVACGRLRGEPA